MRNWPKIAIVCIPSFTILLLAQGCVATRNWVREQMDPLQGRVNAVDKRLGDVDAKADRALAGLGNLRLEKKLVIGMKEGATFDSGSANLSKQAKGEIDRFFKDLEERGGAAVDSTGERVFVIAGHTDSNGQPDYNYELGQRRAERVAGYLVSEKGIDPTRVHVVSYGDTKPVADNKTKTGRRGNRRIEVLVYQEKVSANAR